MASFLYCYPDRLAGIIRLGKEGKEGRLETNIATAMGITGL